MFAVNNKDTEWRQDRRCGVFIVNIEHISHLDLLFFVADFEQLIAARLCILEAAIKSSSLKRSYVMLCKKLGTMKKGSKNWVFHKNNFETRSFNSIPLGFLIFPKDLKKRGQYNLKSEHWDEMQESERKQKFLANDKNMF